MACVVGFKIAWFFVGFNIVMLWFQLRSFHRSRKAERIWMDLVSRWASKMGEISVEYNKNDIADNVGIRPDTKTPSR